MDGQMTRCPDDQMTRSADHRIQRNRARRSQSGYMLMVLVFMMAVMMLALIAVAPRVAQQTKRDREEEMIHRGAQYARAIQRFYRKFGRYPNTIEQLEKTNN